MVDKVLDRAGAKGTGKWMSQLALDLGVPSTLVTEAVYARSLSARKENASARARCSRDPPDDEYEGDKQEFIEQIRQALYASKIVSYAQGLRATASGRRRARLAAELRRLRHAVAGRLHHPRRVPRPHQGGVRRRPEA